MPNELFLDSDLLISKKLIIFNNYVIAMNKWKTIKFSNKISDYDILLYNKYYNLKLLFL